MFRRLVSLHFSKFTKNRYFSDVELYPALLDNYMYMLIDHSSKKVSIVDPVEPNSLIDRISQLGYYLVNVLTTHHHADHDSGNNKVLDHYKNENIKVIGYDKRIEALSHQVKDEEIISFGNYKIRCILTPGHTAGHAIYHVQNIKNKQPDILFSGDTLFVGGCGRLFEGSALEMFESLQKIKELPLDTQIYCGHEYTVKNLMFAMSVEPYNKKVEEKLKWARKQCEKKLVTIPSTLESELETNPFLRTNEETLRKCANSNCEAEVLAYLRSKRNVF